MTDKGKNSLTINVKMWVEVDGRGWGEAKASTQDQGGGWKFLGGVYDFDALWR